MRHWGSTRKLYVSNLTQPILLQQTRMNTDGGLPFDRLTAIFAPLSSISTLPSHTSNKACPTS